MQQGKLYSSSALVIVLLSLTHVHAESVQVPPHPRLYVTSAERSRLHAQGSDPIYARMYQNLMESAEWCLKKTPRKSWIAPVPDDPIYENLYDRFYAMMMDMAITEHLAFAYAISGDPKYGDATREWTLACCRAWKPDADAAPDGGKAYAVMRLLKGAAVGYDMAYDRFSDAERDEIRNMMSATAGNYFAKYFSDPTRSGPKFHTHHAVVEYSSFGVAALALLGEVPDAQKWLDATVIKFKDHLLPNGLASDGAQVEGATFWASTMHYRLFFMDALRRVTGQDLFTEFAVYMNADLALASVAAEKRPGWDEPHQNVVLSPSYGQLNYYAPVLLAMAREYRSPICQHLALWDHTLGSIQETRYITPNRKEQLLFELGGYACLWYESSVKPNTAHTNLSYAFPSVFQAYARGSWDPNGIVAAIDKGGQVVVHAGGIAALIASGTANDSHAVPTVEDNGDVATLAWKEGNDQSVILEVHRPNRVTISWKGLPDGWNFWSLRDPEWSGGRLSWPGCTVRTTAGAIKDVKSKAYSPAHAVGNGKLLLIDPEPRQYPLVFAEPDADGVLAIEIALER